jgi:phosphohistidine swiveling domain-containing protein
MVKKQKSVTPIHITALDLFDDKSIYGGKAASLSRLHRLCYSVPTAWVIPCEYSISKPTINLEPITNENGPRAMFAVRSGAPVSMPGLMKTVLNVSTTKLEEAIKAVWESWDTEHAKLYRNAKGYADDMGTAVIIQKMVKSVKAGVAFTSDPSSDPKKAKFYPLVEYVEGLGDKLVGGEVTPTKADMDSDEFLVLREHLKQIHTVYGPSDVEWCIDKNGTLWFVQQRSLRFAQHAVNIDASGKTILLQGKAIGAPNQVTAVIKSSSSPNITENDAIYVGEFRPEYYPLMVKAAAIICANGGETCHASIIARELNKPAISGIKVNEVQFDGLQVFIDGASGTIYEANKQVKLKKVSKLKKVVKYALSSARMPQFHLIPIAPIYHNRYNANHMLARFYYTIDQLNKGLISQQRKEEVVQEIADVLSLYFYNACLGELRHFNRNGTSNLAVRAALTAKIESLLGYKPNHDGQAFSREGWVAKVNRPESIEQAVEIMEVALACYMKCSWSSSFGGKKWGLITEILLRYLNGEYSPTLFVDMCFNLQHNGGCAFGKFDWMLASPSYLMQQLNYKLNNNISQVMFYATKDVYIDIENYVNKKSILLKSTTTAQAA